MSLWHKEPWCIHHWQSKGEGIYNSMLQGNTLLYARFFFDAANAWQTIMIAEVAEKAVRAIPTQDSVPQTLGWAQIPHRNSWLIGEAFTTRWNNTQIPRQAWQVQKGGDERSEPWFTLFDSHMPMDRRTIHEHGIKYSNTEVQEITVTPLASPKQHL